MAMIRIAKVTYDHHEVKLSKDGTSTIGNQVDALIAQTVKDGGLISEVTFAIDGIEEQHKLAELYSTQEPDSYAIPVTAADYAYATESTKKPRKGY